MPFLTGFTNKAWRIRLEMFFVDEKQWICARTEISLSKQLVSDWFVNNNDSFLNDLEYKIDLLRNWFDISLTNRSKKESCFFHNLKSWVCWGYLEKTDKWNKSFQIGKWFVYEFRIKFKIWNNLFHTSESPNNEISSELQIGSCTYLETG